MLHEKSLLQLLSKGAFGREIAKKLVQISQRATESRAVLDDLLGGRKARLVVSDIATPFINESA